MTKNEQTRILRVPLELRLIREIDRVVAEGTAGYESRGELIRDGQNILTRAAANLHDKHQKAQESQKPVHFHSPDLTDYIKRDRIVDKYFG